MNKIKRSLSSTDETSTLTVTKRCLAFSFIFLILSVILLLVFSAIFLNTSDPVRWSSIIGRLVLYFSAFICSFFLSKKNGQSYVFSGILLGAIITGIIFAASLLYPSNTNSSVIWIILIPIATLLGSVLAIKRQKKAKRRKHHR